MYKCCPLHLKIEFGLEVLSKSAFNILLATVTTYEKDTVKDWKRGIENCKQARMGDDMFAEMCMVKNGVNGTEVFDTISFED